MRPSALIIAHPGHELRAYGWYERIRPTIFVLTTGDGGGNVNDDRLGFSRRLAARVGAPIGSLFGTFADHEIYSALLAREATPFRSWAGALANALIALDPALVVVDSWQMYNVSHDLVHVIARVAADHAAQQLGHAIKFVEYDPAPPALGGTLPRGREVFRIELDQDEFDRKRTAAEDCVSLRQELDAVLTVEGLDAQRVEVYRDVLDLALLVPRAGTIPPYERFGARRVGEGRYDQCILWSEHVQPVVAALRAAKL